MPSLCVCQLSSYAALLAAFCFVNIGCSESDSHHYASGAIARIMLPVQVILTDHPQGGTWQPN